MHFMNLLVIKTKTFSFPVLLLGLLLILINAGCAHLLVENDDLPNKTIALTFDDGPDPTYTDMILDVLKEKDVKATFFLVGSKMKQYPAVTERIYSEGHCLANHTYTHINMEKTSYNEVYSSVLKTETVLQSICGESSKILRPPWGKITPDEKDKLKKSGFKVVLWDVSSKDFMPKITVNGIVVNVMAGVGNNKIVLFHDSDYLGKASRKNTVIALPQIIDFLKEMGYRFVTINEMENIGN
jgi:peptidoglycan-N-acetylglucosamine deacetylase